MENINNTCNVRMCVCELLFEYIRSALYARMHGNLMNAYTFHVPDVLANRTIIQFNN